MSFDEFVRYAKAEIKKYLPAAYAEKEVVVSKVEKLEKSYTGLSVREDNSPCAVADLDMLYGHLEEGASLDTVMKEMSQILETAYPEEIRTLKMGSLEDVKDRLFIRLSQAQGNESLAAACPHRMMGDMLVTYHVFCGAEDGLFSARVTNDMAASFNLTEKELHEMALESTGQLFPVKIAELSEDLTSAPSKSPELLIITNDKVVFGAAALLCEGTKETAADIIGGSYYLLPSSIHEWIAVKEGPAHTVEELENLLQFGNRGVVRDEEVLSNTVYHYDCEENILETAREYQARCEKYTVITIPETIVTWKDSFIRSDSKDALVTLPKGMVIGERDLSGAKAMADHAEPTNDGFVRAFFKETISFVGRDGSCTSVSAEELKEKTSEITYLAVSQKEDEEAFAAGQRYMELEKEDDIDL